MSSKPNHRRGHVRVQDGGPHGRERKRWAVGKSKAKRATASRNRSLARQDVRAGKDAPTHHPWISQKWRGVV